MTKVELPKGVWVRAFFASSSTSFTVTNYPDTVTLKQYRILWQEAGDPAPAVDAEAIVVNLDKETYHNFGFQNTTPQDIYVMSVYDDGSLFY